MRMRDLLRGSQLIFKGPAEYDLSTKHGSSCRSDLQVHGLQMVRSFLQLQLHLHIVLAC